MHYNIKLFRSTKKNLSPFNKNLELPNLQHNILLVVQRTAARNTGIYLFIATQTVTNNYKYVYK